jgi:glycosyltransferase involved in cell wall biosynthesis
MPTIQPLRILISDSVRIWGGAQRFVLEMAGGLTSRGHDVSILTYPGSPLSVRSRESGLPVLEIAIRADAAPWVVMPLALRMRRRPYDVVLTTWERDLKTTALAAKLAGRGTVVIHRRACDDPIKNSARYRWLYTKLATRRSAPWLDERRVSLLYNGIDLRDYESPDPGKWRAELDPEGGHVVIGFVGQLVGRKRLDVVMRALASPELGPLPWRLAIAGKGPDEERLRGLARSLGIEHRVLFNGFVEDGHRWLAATDVVILPSLIEGFGYVLAEAAAAGKPCVSYRASSIPEVVRDGETALLAGYGDDAGFAAHLQRLLTDAGLRKHMGAVARRDAFERHGLERMIDGMEAILARIIPAASRRIG